MFKIIWPPLVAAHTSERWSRSAQTFVKIFLVTVDTALVIITFTFFQNKINFLQYYVFSKKT